MRRVGFILIVSAGLLAWGLNGCRDDSPPPQNVPVPAANNPDVQREQEPVKPLPPPQVQSMDDPPAPTSAPANNPGASNTPAVARPHEALPRQERYLDAYARVGRPRLAVLVSNAIKPALAGADAPAVAVDLTDWLSCDNQVAFIDPSTVRAALSDDEIDGLEHGTLHDLSDVGKRIKADVLVVVRPEKTDTPETRLDAQAFNTRDGLSIASADLNVPTPIDQQIADHSMKDIAGKLMDGMSGTWLMMSAHGAPTAPGASMMPPTTMPVVPSTLPITTP